MIWGDVMKPNRVYGPTPSGGDYSEIVFFNDDGDVVEEKDATCCVIRECKDDGSIVNETWGGVN